MSPQSEYVLRLWEASQVPYRRVGQRRSLVALDLSNILLGLNPAVLRRSKTCTVRVKRVDIKNLRWIFGVDSGNGPKVVRLKAYRAGNTTRLSRMVLDASCSCKFSRWQGPEHHAQREDYLDGKPVGTASVPVVRDPESINRVCKHLAAVLAHVKKWVVPKEVTR